MQPHPQSPPLSPGAALGPYRIEAQIGAGALARVYRVTRDGQTLALKVLGSNDPDDIVRFKREAEATRELAHPNIVAVKDHGEEAGVFYIAMELCTGPTLAKLLKEKRVLSVGETAHVGRQICGALQAAHDAGLLHRDLKPSNVLLHRSFSDPLALKVADFGLVKAIVGPTLPGESGEDVTDLGQIMGSPLYVSPEQIRGHPVGPASDQYALGVLLYRAATGKLPYRITGAVNAMVAHLHAPPIPPAERAPDRPLPDALSALLLRLLAKDPAARFPSMDAVRSELDRISPPQSGIRWSLVVGLGALPVAIVLLWWASQAM